MLSWCILIFCLSVCLAPGRTAVTVNIDRSGAQDGEGGGDGEDGERPRGEREAAHVGVQQAARQFPGGLCVLSFCFFFVWFSVYIGPLALFLSYLILSYLVLSCLSRVWSGLSRVLSCLVLSCPFLVLSCLVLSCLRSAVSCLVLHCLATGHFAEGGGQGGGREEGHAVRLRLQAGRAVREREREGRGNHQEVGCTRTERATHHLIFEKLTCHKIKIKIHAMRILKMREKVIT